MRIYSEALRSRRERLKALGLRHLPRARITEFALDQDILLDEYAAPVIQHLRVLGVPVPPSLYVGENGGQRASIYHSHEWTMCLAMDLYRVGFRDISGLNADGLTPLQTEVRMVSKGESWADTFCRWLIQRGADPFLPYLPAPDDDGDWFSPRNVSPKGESAPAIVTLAHVIAGSLGRRISPEFPQRYHDQDFWIQPWAVPILLSDLQDGNDCHCGPEGGFVSYSYFLIQAFPDNRRMILDLTLVSRMQKLFTWHGMLLDVARYQMVFRFITFAILSLEHTCFLAGSTSDDEESDMSSCADEEEEEARFSLFLSIMSDMDSLIARTFHSADRGNSPGLNFKLSQGRSRFGSSKDSSHPNFARFEKRFDEPTLAGVVGLLV
ncbi:uncharacterized protein B0I36DRAFT_162184 [Microdochium trichocladiopsis]|uniref:Uncharacterized protein n=1 Tax=Microdochium trichocladiopsis TaxID=1682393 RepID=A0A9P8Y059_9PEZI|nr:uncharacterized protein B0I36DRAFT_162184 [Microdochium trichocladiopsis]KAH7024426.1 hypothetical protein B0I36DRAFT_162184 [Microdochium trichocladiopsis]